MITPGNDLAFSKNGDFILESGDLKDTSFDLYEWARQHIRTRVCGLLGDWKLYPTITANLSTELGKPNNKERGTSIENKIKYSLINDGCFSQSDFEVKVFPISINSIAILVKLLGINPTNRSPEVVPVLFTATNTEVNPRISSAN